MKSKPPDSEPRPTWEGYLPTPGHLSTEEYGRWLWEEMDPFADYDITDQWTEIVAAYRRSGGRCGICGGPVDLSITSGRLMPSIDHKAPQGKGGGDDRANLQLAHLGCNCRKGAR